MTVDGAQALAFVRERHIGLGSDLQRIQRQQYFMAAIAQQVTASNMLSSTGRLLTLANAATHSLTTDSGLEMTTLIKIAESMRSLRASSVKMIQVPTVQDPNNADKRRLAAAAGRCSLQRDQVRQHHARGEDQEDGGRRRSTEPATEPKPGQRAGTERHHDGGLGQPDRDGIAAARLQRGGHG